MKATLFSNEHYYPMSMSSGRDAVLVDYGGSGFLSLNGHTHLEPHQGAYFGWYKSAHKTADIRPIQPVVMAGLQVYSHGYPNEPISYEQEFIVEDATLVTEIAFRYGLKLRISSFITYDTSLWCEKVEVLENNPAHTFDLAFRVSEPWFSTRIGVFKEKCSAKIFAKESNTIELTYENVDFTGRGRLVASLPFDKTECGKYQDKCNYAEGRYSDVKTGGVYSRVMFLLGDNEKHASFEELSSLSDKGYDALFTEHKALWNSYFSKSSITLSDKKLEYMHKFSRYISKAHQHPDSGAVTLGMQPNHWNGAICCSWDEEFSHEAFLAMGNFEESLHYTEQYMRQAPIGYEVMKKCGFPGIGFTGWVTMDGSFCGHTSLEEWLTDFKPMFSAYALVTVYNEWRSNPDFDVQKYREICVDVLKFWLHRMVYKAEDGLYYLASVKDGAECGLDAEVDTFTQILFGKSFAYVGEMFGIEEYSEIGKKMLLALECNRLPDGRLALFKGSEDTTVPFVNYYLIYDDKLVSPALFDAEIEKYRNHFGLENEAASEEYRHWPWNDSFAARGFIRNRSYRLAAERLAHMTYGCSALGALPEKLRLDGYPIGYYYTSPHSILVTTVAEAFATVADGQLVLAYGFDEKSANASCENIITFGGLSVSMTLESATLKSLTVENIGKEPITIPVDLNPVIKAENIAKEITLAPGEKYIY